MPRLVRIAERVERFAAFAFAAWRCLFKQDLFGGTIFFAATTQLQLNKIICKI
jgi:hypothetical protein